VSRPIRIQEGRIGSRAPDEHAFRVVSHDERDNGFVWKKERLSVAD